MKYQIPKEVSRITDALKNAGFEAYLVGGCVRDMILGRKPQDWDVTTNATPEEIQGFFENTFYENEYGTVGVVNEGIEDPTLKVVEVTPYRKESGYTNKRHPDVVTFGVTLEEDLSRRDFTVNAIAYDPSDSKGHPKGHFVDPHKGQKDIKDKIIKTVGKPADRFGEDALRILRAVRLASELRFEIEPGSRETIKKMAQNLAEISRERIRDEFVKIIMSDKPMFGMLLAYDLGLTTHIAPALAEGVHVKQNQAHAYVVFEHLMRTLQASADKKLALEVRLAALFHDIAKPHTKAWNEKKEDWSFHGHQVVGAKITAKTLENLRFSRETIEKTVKLVRWHMFFSDTEQITHSAVRRLIKSVGVENVWDLMELRKCDRIGTGRPKESPYRLRKYQAMIEEVMRDPTTVGMLKIDGVRLMEVTREKPGPRIGWILHALLEEVLDDPSKNTLEYMENRATELSVLSDKELQTLGEAGKEKKEEVEETETKKIRGKYGVE